MAEDPTPGTTESERAGGSGNEPSGTRAAGTVGGSAEPSGAEDLKRQLEEEKRKNAQLLSEKTRVEEDRRRLEEERAQTQLPTSDEGRVHNQQAQAYAKIVQLAQAGDPVAQWQLVQLEEQQRRAQTEEEGRRQLMAELEFAKMPAEVVPEVRKLFATRQFWSPASALQAYYGQRYLTEREDLEKRAKELETERTARERDVVNVATRSVGADELKGRTISISEYQERLSKLPIRDRMKLISEVDSGKVRLDYSKT